jgi:NDP-sugar pyrophosphorylase family protein
MQIVIPMSGFGERFRKAGYSVPKPLIEIEGKPIVAHVIDMFPGEQDFIFICNNEHLNNPQYRMKEILNHYCPTGKIMGIEPHKLGPVYAVKQAKNILDLAKPTVVNYCDFTCYWDWNDFKSFAKETACDGAIPAYRGFHPHTLGTTNYAYMQESNGWLTAIQEKQPFTDNRMEEFASSGTYYFSTAQLMLDTFEEVLGRNINVGGEYYVSLAYIPLLEKRRKIAVYELQHFMQWGTPEDVAEYNSWSDTFKRLVKSVGKENQRTAEQAVVIPMAGLGKRFSDEGYTAPKPLIEISGKPMVVQACGHLPQAYEYVFVLREDMPGYAEISETLKSNFPRVRLVSVPQVTDGQATSANIGVQSIDPAFTAPITFGACDFGALYDLEKFNAILDDQGTDLIVWAVRGHTNAIRKPHMFGWINADSEGNILDVSVKKPISSQVASDPIVLGTFTFRSVQHFRRCYERLIERRGLINGEYYLDSCVNDAIALGMKCKIFEVECYMSWGTPNDLKTFEYWQSCLHKWDGHIYRLELDSRVSVDKLAGLTEKYRKMIPSRPRC